MAACDRLVLAPKPITNEVQEIVHTVTAHMEMLPVGTFKYKIFRYSCFYHSRNSRAAILH